MNILITGHRGYLGKFLKKKLITKKFKIKTLSKKITHKTNINYDDINCIIHCSNKFNSSEKKKIFEVNYSISKKILNDFINTKYRETKLFININTIRIKEDLKSDLNLYIESKKKFSNYVKKNVKKKIIFIDFLIPTVFGGIGNGKDFYSEAYFKLKKNKELKLKNPHSSRKFIKLNSFLSQILKIIKKYKYSTKTGYITVEAKYNFKKTLLEFSKYLKIKLISKSKIYF